MYFIFRCRYNSKTFKTFRYFICDFYDNYNVEYSFNSYRITKCRIYNFPKRIIIQIHSLSPGIIIGKGGKDILKLENYMQSRYSKPVKIELKETNPFK